MWIKLVDPNLTVNKHLTTKKSKKDIIVVTRKGTNTHDEGDQENLEEPRERGMATSDLNMEPTSQGPTSSTKKTR